MPALFGQIVVPPAVVAELRAGRQRGLDVPDPDQLPWLVQRDLAAPPSFPGSAELDAGEREAIALALSLGTGPGCRLLIDERDGRKAAHQLGLAHTETLGVLIAGKRAGLIPVVAPRLDRIVARGFRMGDLIRAEALRLAGE